MFDLYNNLVRLVFYGKRPKITVARVGLESQSPQLMARCGQNTKNLSFVSPVSVLGVAATAPSQATSQPCEGNQMQPVSLSAF